MARTRRHLWFHPPRGRTEGPRGERPQRVWSWRGARALLAALPQSATLEVQDPAGDLAIALAAAGHTVRAQGGPVLALKHAALRELPVQSARALLGLDAAGRRVWFLHYLNDALSPEARTWWQSREHWVRAGLSTAGRVGQAAARFRRFALGGIPVDLATPEARRPLVQALSGRSGAVRWATLDPARARALQARLVPQLTDPTLDPLGGLGQLVSGAPPRWLGEHYAAAAAAVREGRLEVTPRPGEAAPVVRIAGQTWTAPSADDRFDDRWISARPQEA